jgi:hypothetical protein
MTTIPAPRRRAAWRPTRRITDYVFRVSLPGRHHTLDTVAALMMIREARA